MAFGIDLGGKLFFSIFSIAASIGILYYLYKAKGDRFAHRFALAMILGGALGNLIDRVFYGLFFEDAQLFYGRVVDFIDVDFFDINILGYHLTRWPVFNIADASVTVGVILLILFRRQTRTELKDEALLAATNYQDAGGNSPHGSLSTSPLNDPIPPSEDQQRG